MSREDALRFIREEGFAVVRPDRLGLAEIERARAGRTGTDGERFLDFLLEGAEAEARGLVLGLYTDGMPVAAIVDGPLRSAMVRLGELWRDDPDGIVVEHRATDLCVRALAELRALLPRAAAAPVAIGGAVAGDPYLLPSMAAAAVLDAEGYAAVNLGPELPVASLERALGRHGPKLVWISISVADDPAGLGRGIGAFAAAAARLGTSVVVGGRAAGALGLPVLPNLHVGGSMAELAAFARGLRFSTA